MNKPEWVPFVDVDFSKVIEQEVSK